MKIETLILLILSVSALVFTLVNHYRRCKKWDKWIEDNLDFTVIKENKEADDK